jgi:hypothetical protein
MFSSCDAAEDESSESNAVGIGDDANASRLRISLSQRWSVLIMKADRACIYIKQK